MTPEEFKAKAQEIYDKYEGEADEGGHMERDNLMSECLESLGYEEGIEILYSMSRIWYS